MSSKPSRVTPAPPLPAPSWAHKLLSSLLVLTLLLYLLHTLSPLRLNNDSYRLLSMALSAHESGAYLVDGYVDQYPTGYPWMIKILLDLGLGSRASINLLSFAWTLVGVLGWGLLIRRLPGFSLSKTLLALLLILCSWISIKHLVLPISDGAYFGLSSFALLFAYTSWKNQSSSALVCGLLALLLSLGTVLLRTVGVSLLLTVGLLALFHPCTRRLFHHLWLTGRRWLLSVGALLLCLGALAAQRILCSEWFHTQTIKPGSYLQSQLAILHQDGPLNTLLNILHYRTTEIAEALLNAPSARMPLPGPALSAIGALCLGALLTFAWRRRQDYLPLLLYLATHCLILFLWPYLDSRFLLPLLPLGVVLLLDGFSPLWNSPSYRKFLYLPLAAFLCIGLAINLLSLRTSLSGKEFPRYYSPTLAPSYWKAFGHPEKSDEKEVQTHIVRMLKRLEPLAQTGDNTP